MERDIILIYLFMDEDSIFKMSLLPHMIYRYIKAQRET